MEDHGVLSRYRGGCRCRPCRDANSEYQRKWRQKNRALAREPITHGGRAYSNYGCRCNCCVVAHAEAQKNVVRVRDAEKRVWEMRAYRAKPQAETLPKATRSRYQWTGPEMELLLRDDLTLTEKALALKRSYLAVREKLRRITSDEPTALWLAGQRSQLHGY